MLITENNANCLVKQKLTSYLQDNIAFEKSFQAEETILQNGQIIYHLPLLLSGNVKIYCEFQEKEFLINFLKTGDICMSSFSHFFQEKVINFSAKALDQVTILLVPFPVIEHLLKTDNTFALLLLQDLDNNYSVLLEKTKQLFCNNLEARLTHYLNELSNVLKTKTIKTTHSQIAFDMGCSREEVSRVLKKLENKNSIKSQKGLISLL